MNPESSITISEKNNPVKSYSTAKLVLELSACVVAVLFTLWAVASTGIVSSLKPTTIHGKVWMFVGIFAMSIVAISVHELGHLIAGLLQGFEFELFIVGPLGIKKEDNKIRVFLNRNLAFYGGAASTLPQVDDPDLGTKFRWVILWGPISSLVFAAACIALAVIVGKPFGITLLIGGVVSIGVFFATTIPSRTGFLYTDRKRFQRLLLAGKERDIECATLKIVSVYRHQHSYKNIAKSEIALLTEDENDYVRLTGWFHLLCFEIEKNGAVESETLSAYRSCAETMNPKLVAVFDAELEQMKDAFSSDRYS